MAANSYAGGPLPFPTTSRIAVMRPPAAIDDETPRRLRGGSAGRPRRLRAARPPENSAMKRARPNGVNTTTP
jgi:hypothetical protein